MNNEYILKFYKFLLENNCLFEYLNELNVQNIREVWVREKKALKKKQASAGRNAKPVTPLQIAGKLIPSRLFILTPPKSNWYSLHKKWCLEIGEKPMGLFSSGWSLTGTKLHDVYWEWAKPTVVPPHVAIQQLNQVLQNSMDNQLGNK